LAFQIKMALLVSAAAFHWAVHRRVAGRAAPSVAVRLLTGGVGLALWLRLVLAGCAFILLE
jgi:hypothetical protein